MRVWLPCLVLGALLVPTLAHANDHNADAAAGFSAGGGGSNLYGFREAVGWEFHETGRLGGFWSVGGVGDVSVHFGSHDGKDVTQVVYMAGPRVTLAKRTWPHLVQVQALAGRVYTNDGIASGTKNAFAVGAAYEVVLTEAVKATTMYKGWALRVQVDRVLRSGESNDFTRFAASVVYRIPRP